MELSTDARCKDVGFYLVKSRQEMRAISSVGYLPAITNDSLGKELQQGQFADSAPDTALVESTLSDPEFRMIVRQWLLLPDAIRDAMVAMVKASKS